jgi:hypothetical protein
MVKKAKLLQQDRLNIVELMHIIERYHAHGSRLQDKLSDA